MPLPLVLLGIVAYLAVCGALVYFVVWPLLGWTVLVGLVLGTIAGTAVMLHAPLAGHARLIGPDQVNEALEFPAHRSAYGRDQAWPHYLARQARVDLEAMVRRVGDVVRTAWGYLDTDHGGGALLFWPFLLLPFVLAGSMTLGAGLAVVLVLAVLVPVLGLALLVWGGLGRLLKWGDGLLRRRNKAEASCPRCFWRTRLPSYPCPSCGVVHRDVSPSRLGVLWHRCRCGRPMPTTVSRAGASIAPQCPQCDEALEKGSGVLTDVSVPVFGPVSAGKTSLIYAMLAALDDALIAAGGALVPRGTTGPERYRDGVEQVRAGRVAKTEAGDLPEGLVAEVTVGGRTGLLHTFDAAGEFFAADRNAEMRFLDHAGQLIFVVDPFSIPRVAHETLRDAARHSEAAPAVQEPVRAYRTTVQRLNRHGVRLDRTWLAVVVVKADLLVGESVAEGLEPETGSVQAWLEQWGQDHLTTEAVRDFARVSFFLVSSRTGCTAADRHTALAPLRWLAERTRLPLPLPVPDRAEEPA